MNWCDAKSLIPCLPDWLFFLLCILLAIIIYFYLPTEIKKGVNKILVRFGFYIFLFIVWLFWRTRTTLIYQSPDLWPAYMNRATFWVLFIAFCYFALKSWLYEFRYYTNHFVCDNIHGSCHRFQEIGNPGGGENNWVVFFLGGAGPSDENFVFPWPWTKKIIVVPKSACQFLGNQIIAFSQVDKVGVDELPEDVAEFIRNDPFARWCKDEIHFGLWDVKKKSKNPKYSDIQNMLLDKNIGENLRRKMMRNQFSDLKEWVTTSEAIKAKLKSSDNPRPRVSESEE